MRSVVIPAYNEEARIGRAIEALLKMENLEIIISDDGSHDKTVDIARDFANSRIKILENKHRGKGGALIKGFNNSSGEILGFIDADLSSAPSELEKLFKVVERGDIDLAIGSRELRDSVISLKQPSHRRLLGNIYSQLARLLFHVDIRDFQCGCKAFTRELWDSVDVREEGFVFDTELIARANSKGFKIKEVPITWKNDRNSKVNPISDPLNMFLGLLNIKKRLISENISS